MPKPEYRTTEEAQKVRSAALRAAVHHHNRGEDPAHWDTVILTAQRFEDYIRDGE